MNAEYREIANQLFEEWATQRGYSAFSRSPLRRVWLIAFEAAVDLVRSDDDDDAEVVEL